MCMFCLFVTASLLSGFESFSVNSGYLPCCLLFSLDPFGADSRGFGAPFTDHSHHLLSLCFQHGASFCFLPIDFIFMQNESIIPITLNNPSIMQSKEGKMTPCSCKPILPLLKHHPTAHRFESPRFHKSTESDSPTVSCPTSWKNCLKSRRSLLTRATLSLFARIILWMQPPTPVLCTPPRLSLTPRLKASMQPEYAHIVEAAVQYAKVGRGVSVLRILTQCRSTRRRTRSA